MLSIRYWKGREIGRWGLIKHMGYLLLYSIAEADVGGVSMSNPSKI